MHTVVQYAEHVLRHIGGAPLHAPIQNRGELMPVAPAALVVVLIVVGYAVTCWLWPYTACGRCGGSGKARSPSGKAFRDCRRCRGSGRRVRLGRRLWNTHAK